MNWLTPYSKEKHFPFGYDIFFEDTDLHMWFRNKTDADRIVGVLNGAYNLGYAQRSHMGDLAKENKK